MPKASRVFMKVISAEVKQDKDHVLSSEPFCRIEYSNYLFETKKQVESNSNQSQWQDQFQFTYLEKTLMKFYLLVSDDEELTEVCRGELDLGKKLQVNGDVEIVLKTFEGKKEKTMGSLKVTLQWLGDFDIVPFRLELVVHTAEVVKRKELGQCKMCVSMSHKDKQETEAISANEKGRFEFKYRIKWIVTTQEEIRIELIGSGKSSGPYVTLKMSTLKEALPGVLKKFYLMQPIPAAENENPSAIPAMEKKGIVWIVINHNCTEKVDAKSASLGAGRIEGSISPRQRLESGNPMSKLETRQWVYDEFKPKKKEKISLSKLNDRQKAAYLSTQRSALEKLRIHHNTLTDQLEALEDKVDDTVIKLKEKQAKDKKISKEEKKRKAELDVQFQKIRKLQQETEALKEKSIGGSAFDKLKELENTKSFKTKRVEELQKETESINEANKKRELKLKEIDKKNKEEVFSSN